MRRKRITITIKPLILKKLDEVIDGKNIRNRSHAIEKILEEYFSSKINTAVVLAGGEGKNLRPYTWEVPKPLLPVKGRPILEYTIKGLKKAGIEKVYLCIGHLGEKIKEYFKDGSKFGLEIKYIEEKKPLLTGGALNLLKNKLNSPFLVVYGDILTNLDFEELIDFHLQNNPVATIALSLSDHPELYGQISIRGIKLTKFYGKKEQIKSSIVNTGIYVFNPEIFQYFPKNKKRFYLEDVLKELIKKDLVIGYLFDAQWFDVGTKETYERAIKTFQPNQD